MLGQVGSRITHAQQALRYTLRGQAFWVARLWDGREVYEWEVDWSLLPQQGLRLDTPVKQPDRDDDGSVERCYTAHR